ncbi:hypothetical protein SAMN04487988_11554 [Algoriphagus hitonicola]|uniref:Uncharacterized protein n=1 Tax=Algoriphagus hitonicola TaxID=435880 RepID=A0A1I2X4M3_9BACT|nr:hypothetical protein SAMN04487988_11554 [Algoriphagus hitonicola]
MDISDLLFQPFQSNRATLNEMGADLSQQKAIEIAKGIYTIEVQLKSTGKELRKTLLLNESQQKLAKMFPF